MTDPEESGEFTLIYDGDCRLCRRSVDWVEARDGDDRIEVIPYQSSDARERYPGIPREDLERSIHLIGPGGQVWRGARAGEELLRLLPRWRAGAFLFRIPGMRWIAERVYRTVASNRHVFGCGDHCDLSRESSES